MTNKILQKKFKRKVELSEDSKRITLHDNRFYNIQNEWYPSVTSILSMMPKGEHFETWLKKVGFTADYLVKKAADDGTQVHDMIEKYLLGEEIQFLYPDGNMRYQNHVWQMFLNFVEFWEIYKPILIETEVHLYSDELKTAGTCDLIIELNKEKWLLDNKTSNYMSPTYEIQTAVYGKCYKENFGIDIDHYGILWLKSPKRKLNYEKMTGKGWEVIRPTKTFDENIRIFNLLRELWVIENPNPKILTNDFRTSAKREH